MNVNAAKSVNMIILNYNGRSLLEECLPSVVEASRVSSFPCRVTVLDNLSTDDSLDYVKTAFPDVDIRRAENNRFLVSYNDLAGDIEDDIIILLNNDIKLDKGFVDPMVKVFEKKDAFMAGPKCWTFDGKRFEGSRSRIRFHYGHMQSYTRYPGHEKEMDEPGYSAAVGSVVAFDRVKFLELGGFDDLYLPGRLEDLDICYRGWKRGWKGYYQPVSLAFHKSSAAFNEHFGSKASRVMSYRNTFLFTWKNITDLPLIFSHLIFLVPRAVFSAVSLNFEFLQGFIKAVPRMKKALGRRSRVIKDFVLRDKDIFKEVGF